MVQHLRDLADVDPDRVIVEDDHAVWTRAMFNDRANRVASIFAELGLRPRDRVGLFLANSADWALLLATTSLLDLTPVPISIHLGEAEVRQLVAIAKLDALCTDAERADVARVAGGESGLADESVIVTAGEQWEQQLTAASNAEPPTNTHLASPIYFTSGTTGVPKGTRMSLVPDDIALEDYLARMRVLWAHMGLGPDTRHLVTGPLYHSSPGATLGGVVNAGGFARMMKHFDAEQSLALIDRHRINLLGAVPTHFVRWLQLPDDVRARYDLSSLRMVTHTAAICPVHVKRAMIEWVGPILVEGYGGSEFGAMTQIDSATWLDHPGSVGRPLPGLEVGILDDDGNRLPPGEIGRIFARGAGKDIQYLDDPVKTAASHVGEWFTLGDLGWMDDDGFLYITDRRDDLIISGGVNIYPAEVEAVLATHPAVADVAVFGIPDDEWGAQVKAAVSLRPGVEQTPALADELIAHARASLASFKCPRSIDFHDELPRHENGKLYRRLLREAYAARS